MKVAKPVTSLCMITFQKSFIDLKSTQNITLKYLGLYVKHSLHTCSVVLVTFDCYNRLQNSQSNRYSLYSMTSLVVLFAYPIKVTYLDKEGSYINSTKKLCNDFN